MKLCIKLFSLISAVSLIRSHTHDELPKCFLTGVHKGRQTIIESPNYPNNYKPDTCWDYVIRSPYKCPTTFHIQFLDFYLEFSKDCKKDYLAIGLENVDDDVDVLCGQVVGIKKYHTPNGVLRLRFFTDESPWSTGKGFKLLITRLACERDEIFRNTEDYSDDDSDTDNDDTIAVSAPSVNFQLPEIELKELFRNLTGQEQYQIVSVSPVFGFEFNYPTQLPSPPYPATGTVYVPSSEFQGPLSNYPGHNIHNNLRQPCISDNEHQKRFPIVPYYYEAPNGNKLTSYPNILAAKIQNNYLPSHFGSSSVNQNRPQKAASSNEYFPNSSDQDIGPWSSTANLLRAHENPIDSLEACCVTAFQQKHFYLSSPGFPRTIFSNLLPNLQKRDCVFRLQKASINVCRLRVDFKFFDFGTGTAAIQNVCHEDFIEIESQRFCGCRSEYSFTLNWSTAVDKKIRMHMGYSAVPSGGFLLEIVQEECSETELGLMTTERPAGSTFTTFNPNRLNHQLINSQQGQQQQYVNGNSYPTQQQQQQQNINQGFYGGFLQYPLQHTDYLGQLPPLLNVPGGIPTNLQQQNPFLQQQQQQLSTVQNNNLYPSQFGPTYFPYLHPQTFQNNILQQQQQQQQALATKPFGLPQKRHARSNGYQEPVTVVETNSTRKEYYYFDNDALNLNQASSPTFKSNSAATASTWDRKDTGVIEKNDSFGTVTRQGRKCSFDMGDILRLSVDILWITKPICYAPQRNWFTNWIG